MLAETPSFPPSLSFFQKALSSILQRISRRQETALDRGLLSLSYRSMLLNVIAGEGDGQFISTSLEALLEEWPKIREEKGFAFLQFLFETFERKAEALAEYPSFRKLRSDLTNFIEKSLLSGESGSELEDMVKDLPCSRLGVNYYLVNIFEKQKVTPAILRTFFHLFADDIFYFYLNLDQKKSDWRFLERLTKNLAEVDSPHSLAVLKQIYSFGEDALKVRALRAMGQLSSADENFLFRVIRRSNFAQKKEAVFILNRQPATRKKVLQTLFLRRSPFGLKNRTLVEYLRIVEELDLREAAERVASLGKKRFFWNKKLRHEAGNLLSQREALGSLPAVVAFEHHLRYDLKGTHQLSYPRALHPVTCLVSISDIYDELYQKRVRRRQFTSSRIYEVMTRGRGTRFDPEYFDSFYRNMGVWPVGMHVVLSDGRLAVVRRINEADIFSPVVETLDTPEKKEIIDFASLKEKLAICEEVFAPFG